MRAVVGAFVIDVAFVLVFAAVGRSSHDEGLSALGVLEVAWPFLTGLVVGWAVSRQLRGGWPVRPRAALVPWICTVAVGIVLRAVTGAGVAASFVLVASLTLLAFIVGWRCLAEIVRFAAGGLGRWSAQNAREAESARRRR